MMLKNFLKNPKKIFLVDGFGALLTTILLFFVLRNFNVFFGLSKDIFEYLSIIAFTLFVYSITCYFSIKQNWKSFLKIICAINMFYCLLTFAIILYHYETISFFGIIYFLVEIFVITLIVFLEIKLIKQENVKSEINQNQKTK
ncbi:hypothetical protein AAYQ05_06260 [Flavobacterium sp. B11]|uniref:hypothetical protein n=1 Tax=Flavobacterium movens TaxID=214860 RepID=UPI0031D144F5